jgi:thymidylate synthase (methanogen type)
MWNDNNTISASTIAKAWEKSIVLLLSHYKDSECLVPTERGAGAIEIDNVVLKIANPMAEKRISNLCPHQEYAETYSKQLFDQSYHFQVYSRITQLRVGTRKKINQHESIVSKLRDAWYSRRGIITIWTPSEDLNSEHPPCVCLLQYYIRGNKLCLTSFYRSNDAWLCAPGDMIAITNMQKEVAEMLEISPGPYTHFAVSYHIYDYDIPAAYEAFKGRF